VSQKNYNFKLHIPQLDVLPVVGAGDADFYDKTYYVVHCSMPVGSHPILIFLFLFCTLQYLKAML